MFSTVVLSDDRKLWMDGWMDGWIENVCHSPARPSLVTWDLIDSMPISAHKSLCLVKGDQVCPRQYLKLREVSWLAEKDIV